MTKYGPTPPNLIDSEMAAAALGVSPPTVRRLVVKGDLRNHGTDRRLLLDIGEVYTFQERRDASAS